MNGNFETVLYAGVCVMVFLFGITIGSFLNVCILRLPRGESLTKRNSHCMTCGTEIKRYDLIPLFSWIILKGRCRACKAPISPRYSIVEGLTGVLFVLMFLRYDFIADGIIYPALLCLFIAGIIVIGFEDYDTQEMSVCVLVYLGVLAFVTRVMCVLFPTALRGNELRIKDGLIGMFSVSLPLLIIGFVITPLVYILFVSEKHKTLRKLKKRLRKEKLSAKETEKITALAEKTLAEIKSDGPVYGFGMGDVVFMAAGGLMLGWKAAVTAVFIAVILGAAGALITKIKNSGETGNAIAFGPFLAIGLAAASYYGTEIFDLYVSMITVPRV